MGQRNTRAIAFLSILALALPAIAAEPSLDLAKLKLISKRMQEFVDRGDISGTVSVVARNGHIAEIDAVGFADIENKKPMRTDTIVQVMSQTKSVTGVAAMTLVDEGILDLTRPVQDYLPEFKGIQVADKRADGSVTLHAPQHSPTVWELACHISGLAFLPESGEYARINFTLDRTLAEAVRAYAGERLTAEPGTKYIYSNMGIAMLGRIIEVLSGQKYEDFVQQRILSPLEMNDTFFFPPEDKKARIAMIYTPDGSGKLTLARDKAQGGDPAKYRAGAKYPGPELGLFSTASDLCNFYQMLANRGVFHGKRILSAQAVEAMTQDYTPAHTGYGLTLSVQGGAAPLLNLLSPGSFGHGGAFGTDGIVDPKNGLVLIFLPQMVGGNSKSARDAFVQLAESAVQ
jgi:CubicO group peptidase (beta-lactamase class C family)